MSKIDLKKAVEIAYEVDVAVIGGGIAGTAAAVAAAREGKSVLLVESSGCLGGLATNGHVSPFDATKDRKGRTFGGIAKEILDAIDADVSVYGMVKDNKHRTRALVSEDGEVEISLLESVFKFITQIQDEVHRSAIGYHRKLRNKNLEKSQLDEINGVVKTRKTKLLSHFKTIENIKNADLDDLSKVVDSKTAQNIYDFFRK